ncbi:hypothetical protein VTL71DRAFT_14427, partial [Oculimacula yallundae]
MFQIRLPYNTAPPNTTLHYTLLGTKNKEHYLLIITRTSKTKKERRIVSHRTHDHILGGSISPTQHRLRTLPLPRSSTIHHPPSTRPLSSNTTHLPQLAYAFFLNST